MKLSLTPPFIAYASVWAHVQTGFELQLQLQKQAAMVEQELAAPWLDVLFRLKLPEAQHFFKEHAVRKQRIKATIAGDGATLGLGVDDGLARRPSGHLLLALESMK